MLHSALFFDLDGTLIDSRPGILCSLKQTLSDLKIPEARWPADLNQFIGPPLHKSFNSLFAIDPADAETAVKIYREHYSKHGMYDYSVYNGIFDALEFLLSKGFLLSVVTSKSEPFALKIIEHAGLIKYFNHLTGSSPDGLLSEKADLIRVHMKKLGPLPEKGPVMIGDRYHDIRGAKQAGIASAGVLYGYGSEAELKAEHPDYLIGSAAGLTTVFGALTN